MIHYKWNKHPNSTFEFWNVQVLCGELVSENENYVWRALANAASVCVRSMEHQVVFFLIRQVQQFNTKYSRDQKKHVLVRRAQNIKVRFSISPGHALTAARHDAC